MVQYSMRYGSDHESAVITNKHQTSKIVKSHKAKGRAPTKPKRRSASIIHIPQIITRGMDHPQKPWRQSSDFHSMCSFIAYHAQRWFVGRSFMCCQIIRRSRRVKPDSRWMMSTASCRKGAGENLVPRLLLFCLRRKTAPKWSSVTMVRPWRLRIGIIPTKPTMLQQIFPSIK